VIILTRLGNGLPIAVNPDLIERAEHTPDTVITLVDGHKLVVEEPLEDVVSLVRSWRASVAAAAITLARCAPDPNAHGTDDAVDSDAAIADRSGHGGIGRLLRLPAREE
jgi:flagellar protein FlbD